MKTPFKLVWFDVSNNILTSAIFPIDFPESTSVPKQLQVRSNAVSLQTFNTLVNVAFFLTGDPIDVGIIQNTWPTLGGSSRPELNGGFDISFDFGRTYQRFDSSNGVEGSPSTYIPLPVEAIGLGSANQTIGPFDAAHMIVRYVIPPGADIYKKYDIRLALDFDII